MRNNMLVIIVVIFINDAQPSDISWYGNNEHRQVAVVAPMHDEF